MKLSRILQREDKLIQKTGRKWEKVQKKNVIYVL